MYFIAALQESTENDIGYDIGYAIGQNLPYIIILIFAFLIIRYFSKKLKK